MSARTDLAEFFAEHLPKGYEVLDHDASLAQINRPTVIMKQTTVRMMPEAPSATLLIEYTVTIATPSTDERQREVELDDEVLAVCAALDAHDTLRWTEATKVLVADSYLGYDITTQIIQNKE